MFKSLLVVTVSAILFSPGFAHGQLLNMGIIQGVVSDTTNGSGPVGGVTLWASEPGSPSDTLGNVNITDSDGRYTLAVPLEEGQDSREVDVHARKELQYSPADSLGVVVTFLEIDTLNFILQPYIGAIRGTVIDSAFREPIDNVLARAINNISRDTVAYDTSTVTGLCVLNTNETGIFDVLFRHDEFSEEIIEDIEVGEDDIFLDSIIMDRAIWYVDSTTGNDNSGRGSSSKPFATIQKAINYSDSLGGDTVEVWPGTYTGDGNNEIDFSLDLGIARQVVVRSRGGADSTIIDCQATVMEQIRGFTFAMGEDSLSVLDGFTIENGLNSLGAAVYCINGSSPKIINCILKENVATSNGGGIFIDEDCHPIVRDCLIAGNTANKGGGIYGNINCYPTIENCTIVQNVANDNSGGGGIYSFFGFSDSIRVKNCILWDNAANGAFNQIDTIYASYPIVEYCDIQGGWDGIGNIDYDPWFCNPDSGDFHLAANSICMYSGEGGTYMGAFGEPCGDAGVIYGAVTDSSTADPLEDVKVTAKVFSSPDTVYRTKYTDSFGYYYLPIPGIQAPSTAGVVFDLAGYRRYKVVGVDINPGDSVEINVELLPTPGCEYTVGDVNNSGNYNGLDITYGVAYFGGGAPPLDSCECTPGNTWYVSGDVNNSCNYNGLDITYGVAFFGGGDPPQPCEDCPPIEGFNTFATYGDEAIPVILDLKSRSKRSVGGLRDGK